jgi:cation-transporting ATPase E
MPARQVTVGLTTAEANARAERGQSNRVREATSRSVGDILKANLLTRFNALLGSLLVAILIVGPLQDALFGLILIFNALIGIGQELRAKVTLDRLAIVTAPPSTVIRDGVESAIPAAAVVIDDLVSVRSGDEVIVDGVLEADSPIEVNEALLTGEAAPVVKRRGDGLLAGSFVSSGGGVYRATAVGEASYARRLTTQARRFQLVRSELMRGINQILRVVTWIIAPTALLLVVSQLRASASIADAVRGSVAGVITLVPEGLVLLTSAALALAVIRLGRRNVLVQQLPAVEMLARTDVICLDKTGTLTEGRMSVSAVRAVSGQEGWREALGAISRADAHPNPSMQALADFADDPGWTLESSITFSSDRKWSAARFEGQGWWVVGAPDVLAPSAASGVSVSSTGRELLLARAAQVSVDDGIRGLEPLTIAVLSETIKPSAKTTLRLLAEQGVAVKLISGDNPMTVAAIAEQVGLPVAAAIDGRDLPSTTDELKRVVETTSVFGRVTPEQKQGLIHAMRSAGHTVAMVGDGVNDVLALKEADLGIAMGGGSGAARAVAACVLVDGSFDGMPAVLGEGRRVIGNVERLASLFFTKTVYAFLLALAVGIATLPFPFLPRQLTLISAFTIGIPSVFLTLAPSFQPSRAGFLDRVLRFAVPAGVVAGTATFAAYAIATRLPDLVVAEERTVATLVIAAIGLWVLARLSRPLTARRTALLVAMTGGLALTVALPPARELFALDFPCPTVLAAAIGIVCVAYAILEAGDRLMSRAGHGSTVRRGDGWQ